MKKPKWTPMVGKTYLPGDIFTITVTPKKKPQPKHVARLFYADGIQVRRCCCCQSQVPKHEDGCELAALIDCLVSLRDSQAIAGLVRAMMLLDIAPPPKMTTPQQ